MHAGCRGVWDGLLWKERAVARSACQCCPLFAMLKSAKKVFGSLKTVFWGPVSGMCVTCDVLILEPFSLFSGLVHGARRGALGCCLFLGVYPGCISDNPMNVPLALPEGCKAR